MARPRTPSSSRMRPVAGSGNAVIDVSLEELPPGRLLRREEVEELRADDLSRAECFHVRRHDLAVEPRRAARLQMLDEKEQRELRGVGLAVEHRLAGEDAAGVDAVQAAGERAVAPGLDAVRVAGLVQPRVGGDDARVDPRAVLLGTRRGGAAADDGAEVAVDGEREAAPLHGLSQRPPDVELVEEDDRAPPRREPRQRQPLVRPREDAVAIGVAQRLDGEVLADGDDVAARATRIGKAGMRHRSHRTTANAARYAPRAMSPYLAAFAVV